MPSHRANRARRTGEIRAALALGAVLALGVSGTFAYWTDEATVQGTVIQTGTLDITVAGDADDDVATTTLSIAQMVPGNSSAEVLPVANVGTAPARYSLSGGLQGGNADLFDAAASQGAGTGNGLTLTIRAGSDVGTSGTGKSVSCTGGTVVYAGAMRANTSTALLAQRPPSASGPLLTSQSERLCFQIHLSADAPNSLQGRSTSATFTVVGLQDGV